MRIAVDAMGGDNAPHEIVSGTVIAARKLPNLTRLILVGPKNIIRRELDLMGEVPPCIEIHHASEVVEMHDSPAVAIRKKKDSSIGRAVDLVKAGEAEAIFSAGNTGAAVAATTLKLRTLKGVARPAIAAIIPTPERTFILIDAGANPDCTPEMLAQFAVMGRVYSREIIGSENPMVGLLSIGGEDQKGNEVTREAFRMLDAADMNFLGNVESNDLFEGRVDVAVCDGFVGNVVLKTCETVARAIGSWIKEEFTKNPVRMVGGLLLAGGIRNIRRRSDPETYGGAPLLGVNGVCIIGHGSSSARAVTNAIRFAGESVAHKVNHLIEDEVAALGTV